MPFNPGKKDDFDSVLDALETKDFAQTADAADYRIIMDGQNVREKRTDDRPKHTCQQCGGTGRYLGVRVHQDKENCFACGGKGFFLKSSAERFKNREKAKERKAKRMESDLVLFDEAHPGLRNFLESASQWSGFAGSILTAVNKYGDLTEKQLCAALSMRAKTAERQAAKEIEKETAQKAKEAKDAADAALEPTLDRLAKAFLESSVQLKHPKLRLQTEDGLPVTLSRAGANSRNAGHIYITDGGPYGANIYYGRITPDGKALYKDAPASVIAMLEKFNADPKAEMLIQGQRTGRCCLCGRELTNAVSLALGVGPVCADKWGFA